MIITIDTPFAESSTKFLGGKHILIDVKETRDGCVLGIEPIARIIDDKPDAGDVAYDVRVDLDGREYPFHISQQFASYYPNQDNISLDVRQRLKSKYLAFHSPKPLIIKTCQPKGKS